MFRKPMTILAVGLLAASAPPALADHNSAAPSGERVLEGFGEDMPLNLAIRQIVPHKYAVHYGAGVDVETEVDWSGGARWQRVLREVGQQAGLSVEIRQTDVRLRKHAAPARASGGTGFEIMGGKGDWSESGNRPRASSPNPDNYIELDGGSNQRADTPERVRGPRKDAAHGESDRGRRARRTDPRRSGQATDSHHGHHDARSQDRSGPDSQRTGRPERVWTVQAGQTLRDVLGAWSRRAGWQLVYNSRYTYPIEAGAEFRGSFIDVVNALLEAMGNRKPRVDGEIYKGNETVVVRTGGGGIVE